MCVVSYINTYGQQLPIEQWTQITWREYQELLRKAAEWDKLSGQPDCVDPAKEVWQKKIEERLAALEAEV